MALPQVNAALLLLAAVAGRGPAAARALAGRLDFDLPALAKAARPPRHAPAAGSGASDAALQVCIL